MAKLQVIARDPGDKFHPDPERSYTMPARYYTSPEIYEQEKEAIFYRSWNFAGHAGLRWSHLVGQVGSGAAYIETLMVTENGLEVMSNHPRTLVVV